MMWSLAEIVDSKLNKLNNSIENISNMDEGGVKPCNKRKETDDSAEVQTIEGGDGIQSIQE